MQVNNNNKEPPKTITPLSTEKKKKSSLDPDAASVNGLTNTPTHPPLVTPRLGFLPLFCRSRSRTLPESTTSLKRLDASPFKGPQARTLDGERVVSLIDFFRGSCFHPGFSSDRFMLCSGSMWALRCGRSMARLPCAGGRGHELSFIE